jgi:hypothetical protein
MNMKELIVALISFTLGYFTAVTDAYAQTQYFYGPNGNSAGTSFQSGNTTYFYGPNGNSAGTAFQSGNTTYYYGAQGQSEGTASQYGNTTYYYGPQGQPAGTVMSPNAPVRSPAPIYTPMPSAPAYNSFFGR